MAGMSKLAKSTAVSVAAIGGVESIYLRGAAKPVNYEASFLQKAEKADAVKDRLHIEEKEQLITDYDDAVKKSKGDLSSTEVEKLKTKVIRCLYKIILSADVDPKFVDNMKVNLEMFDTDDTKHLIDEYRKEVNMTDDEILEHYKDEQIDSKQRKLVEYTGETLDLKGISDHQNKLKELDDAINQARNQAQAFERLMKQSNKNQKLSTEDLQIAGLKDKEDFIKAKARVEEKKKQREQEEAKK